MPEVNITATETGPSASVSYGGGKREFTATEDNPTFMGGGGGGWRVFTATEANPLLAEPAVTTDLASVVGQASATLDGTLDDEGLGPCECGFEWGETELYGNTTPTQSRRTGQTFAQTISGLDPAKTYHFKAFATNVIGTSYGDDRTFTTLVALPTVTTDPASALSAIAATPNGTMMEVRLVIAALSGGWILAMALPPQLRARQQASPSLR